MSALVMVMGMRSMGLIQIFWIFLAGFEWESHSNLDVLSKIFDSYARGWKKDEENGICKIIQKWSWCESGVILSQRFIGTDYLRDCQDKLRFLARNS